MKIKAALLYASSGLGEMRIKIGASGLCHPGWKLVDGAIQTSVDRFEPDNMAWAWVVFK